MKIRVESNFAFTVSSIHYLPNGELRIRLETEDASTENKYEYEVFLGGGKAEKRSTYSLLEYARRFAQTSSVKDKTKDSYRLMENHLEKYGDCMLEEVTTNYLQGYIAYLQARGLRAGSVLLYFQKLACVLHDAYKNGLFDERILLRVKRPKREQEKKEFLSETELKKLTAHRLSDEYNNIQTMFLFSCMTGLRYSDVQGLRWKNVKRDGKHLHLEFRQQKTDARERLPLCPEAEALLRGLKRSGTFVFEKGSNQKTNMVLERWRKMAKIKKHISFHIARHTFCVLLLTKEVPIYTVQQLMGHSDIETTKVYADLHNKTMAKAVRKLPKIMY